MSELIKKALEVARHELTTLHNLTVTDKPDSGSAWTSNTSDAVALIDQAINQLSGNDNHPS